MDQINNQNLILWTRQRPVINYLIEILNTFGYNVFGYGKNV